MDAKLQGLLAKMANLGTDTVAKRATVQVYGAVGTGKTVLAVSLAQALAGDGTIVYVDSRSNYESIGNHPGLEQGVIRMPAESWADVSGIAGLIADKSKPLGDVTVVVLDEMSTLCEMLLDELYRADVGARPGMIPVDAVEGKLYKPMGDATFRVLSDLQRLGVHVILVAHERFDKDHRGVTLTGPSYSPQNSKGIARLLTVSAHLTTEIVNKADKSGQAVYARIVQSHPSALVSAKSRIGQLPFKTDPEEWINHIWAYINGSSQPVDENRPLVEDDLPTDGVPVADFGGEPVVVDE